MVCQRADRKGGVLLLHFTHVQSTVGPLFYGLSKGWPQRRGSTAALHTRTEYSRTSRLRSVKGMTAKERFYCCTSQSWVTDQPTLTGFPLGTGTIITILRFVSDPESVLRVPNLQCHPLVQRPVWILCYNNYYHLGSIAHRDIVRDEEGKEVT